MCGDNLSFYNTEEAIKNEQSRQNRRGNQEWTIQRNWQHWSHKTLNEDKQSKYTPQKTKKMSKTDPTKNRCERRCSRMVGSSCLL